MENELNKGLIINDDVIDWCWYSKVMGWTKDVEGAKFKIGQRVRFTDEVCKIYNGIYFYEICGINLVDDKFEYVLDGANYLAWESQLTDKEFEEEENES